jgi:DNA-binding MarR family transcriptional regulator
MANALLNWAFKQTDLSGGDKWVLIVLANRADKTTHQCFPSLTQIARDAGLDRSTVTRCIMHLLEKGKISREKDGTQKTIYTLQLGAPRTQSTRCITHQVHNALGALRTKSPPVSLFPEPKVPIQEIGTLKLGEHGWTRLTSEEHTKLTAKLNGRLGDYIQDFDTWVQTAPDAKHDGVRRRDRNAYASICSWYSRDVKTGKVRASRDVPQNSLLHTYTTARCEICSPPHEWTTDDSYCDTSIRVMACPDWRKR